MLTLGLMKKQDNLFSDLSGGIAFRICYLLEKKNMTQIHLAKKLGKHKEEVNNWLSGERNFTLRTLAKIEVALGEPIILIAQ